MSRSKPWITQRRKLIEIEDASDLIFREALRRLGRRKLDTELLQRKMAEVVEEQGEARELNPDPLVYF